MTRPGSSAPTPFREEHVRLADGATLWTASDDGDGPALVVLHGGPGMWDYLGPIADLARGSFRTHRYDQRGCGRSSASDDYRLARNVADLDELRIHFGHERWYVFGHSFGATLGLEYAAAHGDRVAGLLYCSGVGLDWPTHRPIHEANKRDRLGPADAGRLVELGRRDRTWEEEVEWRTLSWLPDAADPAVARSLARTPFPINLACHRAVNAETNARTGADERARWSTVAAPVRVVHGSDDPRPVDGPAALASLLPSATLHVVSGAGHQPWHERPDEIARILAEVADR